MNMRNLALPVLFLALAASACQGTPAANNKHAAEASAAPVSYDRPGYVTAVVDGRLWVFRAGSKEHADFQQNGVPTVSVGRIGAGPSGMTLKAPDMEILDGWLAAK